MRLHNNVEVYFKWKLSSMTIFVVAKFYNLCCGIHVYSEMTLNEKRKLCQRGFTVTACNLLHFSILDYYIMNQVLQYVIMLYSSWT